MKDKVLVLRTSDKNHQSYGGFQWPKEVGAKVVCRDWEPTGECGNGLHGALWGEGDGGLFSWDKNAVWQVVEVDKESIIDLRGKVKFPECVIRHIGNQESATKYLSENGGLDKAIIGGTSTSGHFGISISGDEGISTSGEKGTSISGEKGTSTSGHFGISISGDFGTSTSGLGGTSISGDKGISISGDKGIIQIAFFYEGGRRIKTGYIGEDGLKPNTPYKLDDDFNFVEVNK